MLCFLVGRKKIISLGRKTIPPLPVLNGPPLGAQQWCHYVQKGLCSEGSMFRKYMFKRFYVQKALYSEGPMFRWFYVQKILYSEGPMFSKKCSEGPIFRYIQKVLYSENSLFYVGKKLTSFGFR